jgi:hypothetical protein
VSFSCVATTPPRSSPSATGALSFDELLATAAQLEQDMQRAAARTTLPEDVDHDQADRLAVELMLEAPA